MSMNQTAPIPAPTVEANLLSTVFNNINDFFSFQYIGNVNESYIRNFTFTQGVNPLSSIIGVSICVALYVGLVRAMEYWVKQRGKPFDLNWFVIFHNSLMSIMSAVLWLAMVQELYSIWSRYGFWSLSCDPAGLHVVGPIYFIYFVNYVFKYIELVDTFLLALRGKPIPFLHIYHHAATLVLCWSQLWAESCIQWLPIVINLLVHIIMYAYYTLHALGYDIWWKKYLTMLQIVQFIAALTGCIAAFGTRILAQSFHILPTETYGCNGTYGGAWVGIAIIASYLYLFMVMYNNTYNRKKNPTTVDKRVAPITNGHSNGRHQD